MTARQRLCYRSDVEHVRRFLAYAKDTLNKTRYFPSIGGYRYIAALALYSKCITVAEAIIVLLDAGYKDEAFGMTRTLIDIFISLHYIANEDPDGRGKLYCQFFAKDIEVWGELIKTIGRNKFTPLTRRCYKSLVPTHTPIGGQAKPSPRWPWSRTRLKSTQLRVNQQFMILPIA